MTNMDFFNIVVGISTILSLGLSIFATVKVISIKNSLNITNRTASKIRTGNQSINGSGNKQAGGSING